MPTCLHRVLPGKGQALERWASIVALFVKGVVGDVEHNSGTMQTATGPLNWANAVVQVGGESVKFKVKQTGESVPIPAEGDRVEIAVSVNLKQRVGDLLHPFVLELVAYDCTVVADAASVDAARAAKSVASVPSRPAQTA